MLDRPVLNLCNSVWIDAINDEARDRRLTVLLNAQMGNMTLSYGGGQLLAELMRRGQWMKWSRAVAALLRNGEGVCAVLWQPLSAHGCR